MLSLLSQNGIFLMKCRASVVNSECRVSVELMVSVVELTVRAVELTVRAVELMVSVVELTVSIG